MNEKENDAYINYIHRFFEKWLPIYDWFAFPIFYVYQLTIAELNPQPNEKLLDICTGTGELAIRLAKSQASITGIDITPHMLNKAKAKSTGLAITFLEMDARKLNFPDKHFEKSSISLALHDMPRPVRIQALQEAVRVTKGKLVIADYYFSDNKLLRSLVLSFLKLFETSYITRFSEEGVDGLLRELELSPVKIRKLFPCFAIYAVDCS